MSRDAEEFYRRENNKARAESNEKALKAVGALAGLAATGVSKIFGHFAAKKQEKAESKFAELSEALANDLGIEDTGTLSKEFETTLVGVAAKLLAVLAKRTNRLSEKTPEGIIATFCFFGINYTGSEPFGTLAPMVIDSFSESEKETPEGLKRKEYWDKLVDIINTEIAAVVKSNNEIDFKSVIKSKAAELKEWQGNENLALGIFYAAASYLAFPKGELNQKTTRLLQEIFPLLGLDADSAQQVVDDAEANCESHIRDLENVYMNTPLFLVEGEENDGN